MSNITLSKLEELIEKAVDNALAKRQKRSANAELLNFVQVPKPRKNASKKRKAKKVEPTRIDMPEGWETAMIEVEVPDTSENAKEGATCIEVRTGIEHRKLNYLEARAKGKSYGVANRAGLNAVKEALA